jgi:surface protein pspC
LNHNKGEISYFFDFNNGSGLSFVYISGWPRIDSKWYYAYSSGALAVSTTINGYIVNANGEWV